MRKTLTKILVPILLGNLLVASFAFAQNPPPDVRIDQTKASKANGDKAYCEGEYRREIETAFQQKYSTIFVVTIDE